ncbi:MAG: hypothetical protein FD167_1270 [bacterium]|nr:MAG: hypothetical protein FD167_1270 [bacterium]
MEEKDQEIGIDINEAMGAIPSEISSQALRLYIPNKDRCSKEFGTQRKWVLEAANLLSEIGGGCTIMPAVEGIWLDENGIAVWENPVVLYVYVNGNKFIEKLPQLREFLHRLGRETNQGEIVFEYDGQFFRIIEYDGEIK